MYWGIDLKVILALVAGAVLFLAGWFYNGYRWETRYVKMQKSYVEQVVEAQRAARKTEFELQAKADAIRKDMRDAENRLVANYESVIRGLRNRPESRAPLSATPGTGVGSTGAQLARPDSEFLARYAADVERLNRAYLECRDKYSAAREALAGNR